MFGLISKRKLKKDLTRMKSENNLQEFKKSHQDTAQYWQGYEDGNDNVLNYVLYHYCNQLPIKK